MIKLNCDLGESFGSWEMGLDEQAMQHIEQANIACGFHAGDPLVIQKTLTLAKNHGVCVGAHPSYPDLVGFGRRSMQCSSEEIIAMVSYQIAALDGMARVQGLNVEYVKPHGALYNDMMKNIDVRQAIMKAVADYPQTLSLMLQASPDFDIHQAEAKKYNLTLMSEAFADRCYTDNGQLLSRSEQGAVLNTSEMLSQVKQLKEQGTVTTQNGKKLQLNPDSLCVHGDNEASILAIGEIKALLTND